VTFTADRLSEPSQPGHGLRAAMGPMAPDPGVRAKRRTSIVRRIFSEGGLVTLIALSGYLAVGVLLDFHYNTFNGDATSRLANGFYVLYSRDPHVGAIGFVWNPGTSIADLIPLLFYHLWTPLASHMFAASLASAVSMAGAVYQLRCTLAEWGVGRVVRLLLVAFLALNGMIVYYGGNGMSEGLYLFTLLASTRYLLRWLRDDDLASLVYAAVAMGLCYLARNEAVGPAVLAGMVVLGVGIVRRPNVKSGRLWGAITDAVIFEFPFVAAFAGWAVVSYVITGQAFQQFTSVYGTTSQIKVAGSAVLKDRILQDVHDVFYLAPTIPALLIVALFLAARRRDVGILAPLAVLGGGLAFDLLAYAHNSIQPWFRYFITAVPFEILLIGSFFATIPALIATAPAARKPMGRPVRRGATAAAGILVLVLAAPSFVSTLYGMSNPKIGYEETQHLGYIFSEHPTPYYAKAHTTYPAMLAISNYVAAQHWGDGALVVDNFSGCIPQVILMSPDPDVFVIPNDRSFQRTLADPLTFQAHYILDVDPTGDGALTAPNISYPNLWKTGDGFTQVVRTFPAKGECPEFKLFKVTGHPNQ